MLIEIISLSSTVNFGSFFYWHSPQVNVSNMKITKKWVIHSEINHAITSSLSWVICIFDPWIVASKNILYNNPLYYDASICLFTLMFDTIQNEILWLSSYLLYTYVQKVSAYLVTLLPFLVRGFFLSYKSWFFRITITNKVWNKYSEDDIEILNLKYWIEIKAWFIIPINEFWWR